MESSETSRGQFSFLDKLYLGFLVVAIFVPLGLAIEPGPHFGSFAAGLKVSTRVVLTIFGPPVNLLPSSPLPGYPTGPGTVFMLELRR